MEQSTAQHVVERWVGRVLRFGVWGSAALIAAGLLSAWLDHGATNLPATNPSPLEVLRNLLSGSPDSVTLMFAGLLLLMLTPFLRVLTAAAGFAVEKDKRFTIVSLVIFFMLMGEFIYSLR